jgi:vacuolar protein sorting-associated protein 26
VYFTLVKLRIVYMTMTFYRIEEYRADLTVMQSKEVLKTYDLMDGTPVRGEMIPIRIYMTDLNIWPYLEFNGSALKVEDIAWTLQCSHTTIADAIHSDMPPSPLSSEAKGR